MTFSDEQKKTMREVVKYNASRKYFGAWSPRELHYTYSILLRNSDIESMSLRIGKLSEDTICNALWNEMSYNPLRWGTKSPFVFDGKNSLYDFCEKEIESEDEETIKTLSELQNALSEFNKNVHKYDLDFFKNGQLKDSILKIKLNMISTSVGEQKLKANLVYNILACLVRSINAVCKQNLKDFDRKKYFEQIAEVIAARHPTLHRNKEPLTAILQQQTINIQNVQPSVSTKSFKEILETKAKLESAIYDITNEISIIQSHINTLNNEYENPGDTSAENARLNKQTAMLQEYEDKLDKIKKILNTSYEYNK